MFDFEWFDGDIGIGEWMFIGPLSEELAEEEQERRRHEDTLDERDDDKW